MLKPVTRNPLDRQRRLVLQFSWIALDLIALGIAALVAAWVLDRYPSPGAWGLIALTAMVRVAAFIRLGMYRAVLRYSGIHTQFCAAVGVGTGSLIAIATASLLYFNQQGGLGRAFWVLEGLLALMFTGGMRLTGRMILERMGNRITGASRRVLIYGAGSLGELALRDLNRVPGYQAVGFLDDDRRRHKSVIHGKRVFGGLDAFDDIVEKHRVALVVVAMTDPPAEATQQLFRSAMAKGIHVLLAKGVGTALDEGSQKLGLRDLALEDLLKRPSRNLDPEPVQNLIGGKRILVTGAGGSIGSEISRQVATMGASHLAILDHSEFALYQVHDELQREFPHLSITPLLVSLTDRTATALSVSQCKPEIILHAAAYKHVPMVEANPCTGIGNNVASLNNILDAAEKTGVERFVLISTDKAVRPTNAMGASKRACELLLQSRKGNGMTLCAVRFGNVLGSSGSVVPRFLSQIAKGGPVTVTHPDITRYFMLVSEAVALVLQAAARSSADEPEIFILDMGKPVKIVDLARQLIFMHGKQPDEEIAIEFTGLRPGEKTFEELLIGESDHHTDIPDITVAAAKQVDRISLQAQVDQLLCACNEGEIASLISSLSTLVEEWVPSHELRERVEQATAEARRAKLQSRSSANVHR